MASLTRWTWVWTNSGSWWWTGRPGVLRFMGSQRVGHDWATDLIWARQCIILQRERRIFSRSPLLTSHGRSWRDLSLSYLERICLNAGVRHFLVAHSCSCSHSFFFSTGKGRAHVPAAPLWVLSLIILKFLFCDTLSFSTLHVWDNIWFSHHSLRALVPVLKWCFSSFICSFVLVFLNFSLFKKFQNATWEIKIWKKPEKKLFIFNWKIIALQYCPGFCHTTIWISHRYTYVWAFWVMLLVKNPPANPGNVRDTGSMSGWEDPLEEGAATHSSILAWRIPGTEEPREQ